MSTFPSYSPVGEIRTSAILTGSYVVAKVFGTGVSTQTGKPNLPAQAVNIESTDLVLGVAFTLGSLGSCDIKIDQSTDGITWFQNTSTVTSSGVSILNARTFRMDGDLTGNFSLPVTYPWLRVSAIGNGTATGSALAIDAHFIRKIS